MTDNPRRWPDYRAIWRWHFYASLFCMPFVIVLSITGAIYLFKPQLDKWADSKYDNLSVQGDAQLVSAQVQAACAAFPAAVPTAYELPTNAQDAARVILQVDGQAQRVFVHPVSLEVLGSRPDDGGFVRQVRSFHGQLGMGERGSNLVELAASWTIIMVVTGLCLWWPRQAEKLAGVVYPRLRKGSKVLLRDLHSVTGVWISLLVLFLLATGLPWAKFWGNYFRSARELVGVTAGSTDWTIGGVMKPESGHEGHGAASKAAPNKSRQGGRKKREVEMPSDLTCFDRLAAAVAPMQLAYPATIEPPTKGSREWIVKSDAQNRPLRVTMKLDGQTGEVLSREDFASKPWLDKAVSLGIAAHEGQLFGWLNQLLGLIAALGLVLLSVSGYIMWWRRRTPGKLGAPTPLAHVGWSWVLVAWVAVLAIYLPLFAASLIVVWLLEQVLLKRIHWTREFLGLRPA